MDRQECCGRGGESGIRIGKRIARTGMKYRRVGKGFTFCQYESFGLGCLRNTDSGLENPLSFLFMQAVCLSHSFTC